MVPVTPKSQTQTRSPAFLSPLARTDLKDEGATCQAILVDDGTRIVKCTRALTTNPKKNPDSPRWMLLNELGVANLVDAAKSESYFIDERIVPALFCWQHDLDHDPKHINDFIRKQRLRLADHERQSESISKRGHELTDMKKSQRITLAHIQNSRNVGADRKNDLKVQGPLSNLTNGDGDGLDLQGSAWARPDGKMQSSGRDSLQNHEVPPSSMKLGSEIGSIIRRMDNITFDEDPEGFPDSPLRGKSHRTHPRTQKLAESKFAPNSGSRHMIAIEEVEEKSNRNPTPIPKVRLEQRQSHRQPDKRHRRFRWWCCFRVDVSDDEERQDDNKYREGQSRHASTSHRHWQSEYEHKTSTLSRDAKHHQQHIEDYVSAPPATQQMVTRPARPTPAIISQPARTPQQGLDGMGAPSHSDAYLDRDRLLSVIPESLSPALTAEILYLLTKPLYKNDGPGFIYMFWLTPSTEDPQTDSTPDEEVTSMIFGQFPAIKPQIKSTNRHPVAGYHISPNSAIKEEGDDDATSIGQALRRYGSVMGYSHLLREKAATAQAADQATKRTILVKIGRATNVTSRMSQWNKQCRQNFTLLRSYPYIPSSTSGTPQPVPNVQLVERLVQLELRSQNVWSNYGAKKKISHSSQHSPGGVTGAEIDTADGKCVGCGRAHREWYEIAATRTGLRQVNEVISRWVNFSIDHPRGAVDAN